MKKSIVKCPYCPKELTISGMTMHVKNMHTDKFEEFKKNFAELKKTAVLRDSATKEEVKGQMPLKVEDKPPEPPKEPAKEPSKEPEKKKEGDAEPKKGGSFLRELNEFNDWLDSPEL